jgi:phospholipid/cholesterol/gamma-HCH transport system substrate-binding protein
MKTRCFNRELTLEVIVGAFMMTVLLGLGYFTILLSRESWFQKREYMEVLFENVMGLRDGESVVCRGMEVGKVKSIHMAGDGVHVRVSLDAPLRLREDYAITVETTSILGGRNLTIALGSDGKPEAQPLELYRGTPPKDLLTDATELVSGLRKSLIEDGTVDNLRAASEELRAIAQRVSAGEGTLGKLLSSDTRLYDDMAATVGSLKTVAERIEKGQGVLGKLLSEDDALYTDLAGTVKSLRATAERIEKGDGTLQKLLSDDARLYTDLADGIAALKRIAERVDRGEGLLGKLTTDDALYNEVRAAVNDVRQAIDDMRETTPVTTFTSVFFGAF